MGMTSSNTFHFYIFSIAVGGDIFLFEETRVSVSVKDRERGKWRWPKRNQNRNAKKTLHAQIKKNWCCCCNSFIKSSRFPISPISYSRFPIISLIPSLFHGLINRPGRVGEEKREKLRWQKMNKNLQNNRRRARNGQKKLKNCKRVIIILFPSAGGRPQDALVGGAGGGHHHCWRTTGRFNGGSRWISGSFCYRCWCGCRRCWCSGCHCCCCRRSCILVSLLSSGCFRSLGSRLPIDDQCPPPAAASQSLASCYLPLASLAVVRWCRKWLHRLRYDQTTTTPRRRT